MIRPRVVKVIENRKHKLSLLLKSNVANRNKIVYLYARGMTKTKSIYRTSVRLLFAPRRPKFRVKKKKKFNLKKTKLKNKSQAVNVKLKNNLISATKFAYKKRRIKNTLLRSKIINNKILVLGYNSKLNSNYSNKNYFANKHLARDLSFKFKRPFKSLLFVMPKASLKIINSTNQLLLNYVSPFVKFRLITSNFKFRSKKFLVKKALFSFLKPNESKRNIMNRRKRINSSRLYRQLQRSSAHLISKTNNKFFKTSSRTKRHLFDVANLNVKLKESAQAKGSSELFLPRVKFKPGYQRI